MDVNIIIRHANFQDASLLAAIGAATFEDAFAEDNTPENLAAYLQESFSPALQAAELADAANTFLIAESEGQPLGYAKLRAGKPPSSVGSEDAIELQRIYVLNEWIGHGVGANLMRACLDEAASRRYATIWLGVWEHNPRAIAFYTRWGFEPVGTHVFQLGDDPQTDLLMRRPVAP